MKPIDKIELAEALALNLTDLKKGFDRKEEMHFNRTNVCLYDEIKSAVIFGFDARDSEINEIQNNHEALMIDFGVWLSGNYNTTNKEDEWFCSNDTPMGDKFTTKQLFELYKQNNNK
jgi:hypothetical protein